MLLGWPNGHATTTGSLCCLVPPVVSGMDWMDGWMDGWMMMRDGTVCVYCIVVFFWGGRGVSQNGG